MDVSGLPPLYIQGDDLAGVDVLRSVLRETGMRFASRPEEADLILSLLSEVRSRRALSINISGKVQEYELRYQITFSVMDKSSKVLMPQQSVSLLRDFDYSGTDVLSKETEADGLYQLMRRDAAGQILLRLKSQLGKSQLGKSQLGSGATP